jgi:hypothetical protein
MAEVSVKLLAVDNENKNVNLPVTEFKESILKDDVKCIGVLVKVDPTKDAWGDFQLDFKIKNRYGGSNVTTSANYGSTTFVTSNAYGQTKSYSNVATTSTAVGDDVYYQPAGAVVSYVPSYGAASSDVKIMCTKCENMCDYGQDYCDKCGESTKDDSVYEGYFDASTN